MTQAIHIVGAVLLLALIGAAGEYFFRRRRSRSPFGPEFDKNDPSAPRRPDDMSGNP